MINVKDYAITINNLDLMERLKSIGHAYTFLSRYGKVYIIAREHNEINKNTHYHALISCDINNNENDLLTSGVWFKSLDSDLEIEKYINYIKKGGKYKTFNLHPLSIDSNTSWTYKIRELTFQYDTIGDLLNENPDMIKYIKYIEASYRYLKK